MDGATSSIQMVDCDDDDWVCGDATTNRIFVDKHWLKQTQSTCFRFGHRDAEEMIDRKGSNLG
uniref:Uncharacterized protein n=1 Tax=Cucumis melo TaxID=3656 RepID=A0A9I9CGJ4_CUCME